MQQILKQLENIIEECSKRLAELAREKKEYEAKFQDLSGLEAKLKEQGQDLDTREKKVKQIENIVEYSESVTIEAKRVKEEGLELAKGQKALQTERIEFEADKTTSLKEIEKGRIANEKQQKALLADKVEMDKKVAVAQKIIDSVK